MQRSARLGIDIGGSSIKLALVRDDQAPPLTAQSRRYARPDADALAGVLAEALAPWTEALGSVQAAGLCAPGVVDARGVVVASVNMPALAGVSLVDLARRAAPPLHAAPFTLLTDALAAATELWHARPRPRVEPQRPHRLLAVSLGTGVGACVLDDAAPVRVTGVSSGHLGQIDVTLGDAGAVPPLGPDGGRGSLEAYIGLPALEARPGGAAAWLSAPSVNDPPLRALIRALRIGHAIYRPDTIALLGGVGIALGQAGLGPALRERVANELTALARPAWRLEFGSTPFHAALGAARLAADGPASTPQICAP